MVVVCRPKTNNIALLRVLKTGNNMTDQNNSEQPKPFAFESEAQFTETVNKIIGGHVTKRFESFESRVFGKLDEKFSQFNQPAKVEEKETEDKLSLKKLQEQITKQNKELADERAANKDKTLRAALTESFSKSGLPVTTQKLAISHLISDKKAFIGEDGEPVFVGEYQGETLPLSEGVSNWLKNEAKDLLPAKQGAGMRNVKTNQNQTQVVGPSEQEQNAHIHDLIMQRRNLGL